MTLEQIEARFKILSDTPILHRADKRGEVVVRVQKVYDTVTGITTTVNFWANWENPARTTRVTSYSDKAQPEPLRNDFSKLDHSPEGRLAMVQCWE